MLFSDGEGKRGTLARIIKMNGDDLRLPMVGDLDKKIHLEASESFFYGWEIVRRYTSDEMASACLFQLMIAPSAYFEPAGEECGTVYDNSTACAGCGGSQRFLPPVFAAEGMPLKLWIPSRVVPRTLPVVVSTMGLVLAWAIAGRALASMAPPVSVMNWRRWVLGMVI